VSKERGYQVPITWKKVGVLVVIVMMVAGWRWLDNHGYLGNPLDKVPSVEIVK